MVGYKVNKDALHDIINYLAGYVYREVFELIMALQKSALQDPADQENFVIPEQVFDVLQNFLADKKYNEVSRYINFLSQATRIELKQAPTAGAEAEETKAEVVEEAKEVVEETEAVEETKEVVEESSSQ